jgi:hypothetical protein
MIKYAILNKTTAVHAAGPPNRLLNNNGKHKNENTSELRSYL